MNSTLQAVSKPSVSPVSTAPCPLQRTAVDDAPQGIRDVLRSPDYTNGAAALSGADIRPGPDFSHIRVRSGARLQRQPASETVAPAGAAEEAEVRGDRERFEAARAQHQQRLKEMGEREQPHALKAAGVTGQSPAGDNAAQLIQAAIAESRMLRPYLRSRLGPNEGQVRITDGRFQKHDTLDDFAAAWATYTGRPTTHISDALRREAAGIGGFYDRARKRIHLNPKATLGHALHEAMHKVSTRAIEALFGEFLNEGITQYFADAVLAEQGLGPATGHRYGPQLACAQAFVALFGRDDVARVQFSGAGGNELVARVRQRLNITDQERISLVQKGQFCQRIQAAITPARTSPAAASGGGSQR